MAQTYTVSTAPELQDALSNANGGDTILLESGRYGAVEIKNMNYDDFVTIRSADGDRGAVFDSLDVHASSYVRMESVHVDNPSNGAPGSRVVSVDDGSSYVELLNSEINGKVDSNFDGHYGLYAGNASNVRFEGNFVHDVRHGIVCLSTDNVEVVDNTIDHVRSDSMKFAGNTGVLIENNTGARTVHPKDGDHVDFIQFQGDANDIVIRGNVSLPAHNQYSQGIFLNGGSTDSYDNVLIEQNIIYNELINGIKVHQGSNVTIRENTVLTAPESGHKASLISAPDNATVTNNVVGSYYGEIEQTRVQAQHTDPNGTAYYDSLYVNASKGVGITIEDLKPVEGSAVDFGTGLGAEQRIGELLSMSGGVTATEDSFAVVSGDTLAFDDQDLLSNDSGDNLSVVDVGTADNGTLTDDGGGSYTYTPDSGFAGEETIRYTISNGDGGTDDGRITITVDDGPDAPNAQDDSQTVRTGTTATLDVLANDSDPDGDSLSISGFEQPANGSVTANDDGTLSYTADDGFTGTDSFTYTIDDGTGRTDQATVTLEVTDATAPLLERTGLTYDGTTASATVLSHQEAYEISEGSLELSFTPDTVSGRQGIFTKDASYFGTGGHLSIVIEGTNLIGRLQSESATQKLVAEDAVTAGTANSAVVTFGSGGFKLYANGSLADESSYTGGIGANTEPVVIGANQWASDDGTANQLQDAYDGTIGRLGLLDYALSAEEVAARHGTTDDGTTDDGTTDDGTTDDGGDTVNTAPDAVDDSVTTGADPSATLDPLANDSDPDGDALSLASFEQPSNGEVSENSDGTLTYTANDGFVGTDSFGYTITDGAGGSDSATVQVEVPERSGAMRVFEAAGLSFDGSTSSAEVYAHDSAYTVDNGQLAIRFTADDTNGFQALMSKDSREYDNGGHLTMWLDGTDLLARVQSDSSDHVVSVSDAVTAGQSHDVVLDFGDDGLSLWFDGETVDSDSYTGGLSGNAEPIVAGANQWASGDRAADRLEDAFNGDIDALALYDGKAADVQTASATEMSDLFAF